jgi:hypothetical protein
MSQYAIIEFNSAAEAVAATNAIVQIDLVAGSLDAAANNVNRRYDKFPLSVRLRPSYNTAGKFQD